MKGASVYLLSFEIAASDGAKSPTTYGTDALTRSVFLYVKDARAAHGGIKIASKPKTGEKEP